MRYKTVGRSLGLLIFPLFLLSYQAFSEDMGSEIEQDWADEEVSSLPDDDEMLGSSSSNNQGQMEEVIDPPEELTDRPPRIRVPHDYGPIGMYNTDDLVELNPIVANALQGNPISSDTEQFRAKVIQLAQQMDAVAPDFRIHLGFTWQPLPPGASNSGNLQRADGMNLSSFYVSSSAGLRSCGGEDGESSLRVCVDEMLQIVSNPQALTTAISRTRGICGILSVLHGLMNLSMVYPEWQGVYNPNDRDYWHDGFVNAIFTQMGSPNGCHSSHARTGFGAEWNNLYYSYSSIYRRYVESAYRYFEISNLQSYCGVLQNYSNANEPGVRNGRDNACLLSIGNRTTREGHIVPVETNGVIWRNGGCDVMAANTNRQGSPRGTNVPSRPGRHKWRITGTAANTSIEAIEGSDQEVIRRLGFDTTYFQCFDYSQRSFYFSDRPSEEAWGSAANSW